MRCFLPVHLRGPLKTDPGSVSLSSALRRAPSHAVLAEAVRFGLYWGQTEQEGPAPEAGLDPSEQLSGPLEPSTTAHARRAPCCGTLWEVCCPAPPAA